MHRIAAKLSKAGLAGALLVAAAMLTGCADDFDAEPAVYPSAGYLAVTAPVYYEGRPAYFYGNRWYYRQGGGWGYYRSEPAYLRARRGYYGGQYGGGYVYGGGGRYRGGGGRRR